MQCLCICHQKKNLLAKQSFEATRLPTLQKKTIKVQHKLSEVVKP
jgi:hypothetical protein